MRGDSSRSLSAQINTIPIPILNVRNISCSETLPSLCITPKTGSSGHVLVDFDRNTVGQNAQYVLEKAAARDVRESLDASRIQQWTDAARNFGGS